MVLTLLHSVAAVHHGNLGCRRQPVTYPPRPPAAYINNLLSSVSSPYTGNLQLHSMYCMHLKPSNALKEPQHSMWLVTPAVGSKLPT
ncbi:hypothetical protein XENTR_v10008290 [Xenopus tropicalis]|nr:hypothetical protein XENTR_v10008290 [Xenopus tropicalis]